MRILLAIPSLRCGGSERVISILGSRWIDEGHQVSLVTFEPPETDYFPLDPRASRFVIGGSSQSGRSWLGVNRDRMRALREVVRETRPDLVLSFLYTMNLLALLGARGLAPVVVAERTDPRHFRAEWWQSALRRILYRTAAAVVVQTEEVLEGWASRVVPRSRAFVVPNPVLPPAGREWNGPELPARFISSVGRLEQGKGFDVLLEAFARIASDKPDWSLVILGEGAERESLEAQAVKLKIDARVLLAGVGDTSALFAQAGVFATATRLEGFPNVLLEAMASGLPVVATDCRSGPREIVRNGVDGYLVPVDDPEALAGALSRLLEDSALREHIGARAREVLDRFGIDRVSVQWNELFALVVREAG